MIEMESVCEFILERLENLLLQIDLLDTEATKKHLLQIIDDAELMRSYVEFWEKNAMLKAIGKPPVRPEDLFGEKDLLVIRFFMKHDDLW